MKFVCPRPLRIAKIDERSSFYKKEFDVKKMAGWFFFIKHPIFAIDVGTDTKIAKLKHKHLLKRMVFISQYSSFKELKKKLEDYAPEDVYYNRNLIKDYDLCKDCDKRNIDCFKCNNFLGQELVFDLDPENLTCDKCRIDKSKVSIFSFCIHCFDKAKKKTEELYNYLKKEYNFKKMKIVYSGRGFHIHALDKRAFYLSQEERRLISNNLLKNNFPIDEWVTNGNIELIRLPLSLNSFVSRICFEIDKKEIRKFNPLDDKRVIPLFIKN